MVVGGGWRKIVDGGHGNEMKGFEQAVQMAFMLSLRMGEELENGKELRVSTDAMLSAISAAAKILTIRCLRTTRWLRFKTWVWGLAILSSALDSSVLRQSCSNYS